MRTLFEAVHRLSAAHPPCHALLAGDYNTSPGSPLYQFMASGSLDLSRHCRTKLSGGWMCTWVVLLNGGTSLTPRGWERVPAALNDTRPGPLALHHGLCIESSSTQG